MSGLATRLRPVEELAARCSRCGKGALRTELVAPKGARSPRRGEPDSPCPECGRLPEPVEVRLAFDPFAPASEEEPEPEAPA